MMITALGIAAMIDLFLASQRPSPGQIAKPVGQVLLVALLVASPAYVTHFREVLQYLWAPTYGSKREAWRTPGTTLEQWRFYFVGPGGAAMLGKHLYLLLTLIV